MEEIWSLDSNMDEIALKRLQDGGWMIQASQQGSFGEPTVFLDRKSLKDLHDAIEHELYPERYLPPVPRKTNYDQLFELMDELGFTEDMINRLIDKVQAKEHEQRTN